MNSEFGIVNSETAVQPTGAGRNLSNLRNLRISGGCMLQ